MQGIFCVIISVLCILFITLFSRAPTLSRVTHLVPLWSYISHGHGKQVILNICLFIPFGYFLASALSTSKHPRLWPILFALLVSAAVETVQLLTYRGMLDVDDLISNGLGAAVGVLIFTILNKCKQGALTVKWMSRVLIAAGFAGCVMAAVPTAKSNISTRITEQFQFFISSVVLENGRSTIEGECFLYDRATPTYTLIIDGSEAAVVMDGEKFRAEAEVSGKAEVQVKFRGFPVMPTGTWINGDKIEYVGGVEPAISSLPEAAVLKAYSPDFDTLVYQDGNKILWLIGWEDLDSNTEVIYHIHTNEPEKLPENRVQYGFDNCGFRVGTEKTENELERVDHYRVFEKEIPQEYNITEVVVGFNTEGTITWNDSFRTE